MNTNSISFQEFKQEIFTNNGLQNEDIIHLFVPLFKQLAKIYDEDKVANLNNFNNLQIVDEEFVIQKEHISAPQKNSIRLHQIMNEKVGVFEVTERIEGKTDIGDGNYTYKSNQIISESEQPTHPTYVENYITYEELIGHYDQKTELFLCGMLMASFAFQLDFNNREDLEKFVRHKDALYSLNTSLHPTILLIISQLTQLDRRKRTRDTQNLIWKLENYRDYNADYETDILKTKGFAQQNTSTRSNWVLNHLKSRLFEVSRRNKLLYFRKSQGFLNLTVGSVPTVLYYEKVKEKDLFLWHNDIQNKIKNQGKINLSKYLRLEEAKYLGSKLDKIRSDARKSLVEYGFSQLKVVIAFLNWYNFKENRDEKIKTPLLLAPATLSKKKGVKDEFVLEFTSSILQVNPILVHQMKELYDIDLPDSIDLNQVTVEEFYEKLKDITENQHKIELALYKKPKIRLIQQIAKRNIAQHQKRTRYRTTEFNVSRYNYSYQNDEIQPLGCQIYKDLIEPSPSFLEYLINDDIQLGKDAFADETKLKDTYQLDSSGEYNPYRWEFDLCNITIGNFNSKKMSLVRDYNTILQDGIENDVFNHLFSDEPKQLPDESEQLASFEDNFYVLNADATQAKAISKAKNGKSIIIQGPPGTGKSQTITNLIADFASRGKRILFVCEKRAALDVVYARLKQSNLHHIATLVHDSQADKKAFILDAKATYEKFIEEDDNFETIQQQRNEIVAEIKKEAQILQKYHTILRQNYATIGTRLVNFIETILQLRAENTNGIEKTNVDYATWLASYDVLEGLSKSLEQVNLSSNPSNYSFIQVDKELLNHQNVSGELQNACNHFIQKIDEWEELAYLNNAEDILEFQLGKLKTLSKYSNTVLQLKQLAQDGILQTNSVEEKAYQQLIDDIEATQQQINQSLEKTQHWKQKLSEQDAKTAKESIQNLEGKFYAFILPKYRKVKQLLQQSYNYSQHQIQPKMTSLLTDLLAEYQLIHQKEEQAQQLNQKLGSLANETSKTLIDNLRHSEQNVAKELVTRNKETLELFNEIQQEFEANEIRIKQLNQYYETNNFKTFKQQLKQINNELKTLPVTLSHLKAFTTIPESVQQLIKTSSSTISEKQMSIAESTLSNLYHQDITILNATGYSLNRSVQVIQRLHKQLLNLNGDYLIEQFKHKFKQQLHNSSLLAKQQSEQEKLDKKAFLKARKILENEFGKSIRYKSIRELKSIESAYVLDLLKPIWLMSPLSVSDTLPVNSNLFDVVIFDEASQITLEEGVPTLYRSNQAIIVGDEMQMPPTNFFTASSAMKNEIEDDEEDKDKIVIDADSMLTHATKKLEDVMLSWHYRSKYEGLIGFSNAAFYNSELLTIPDQLIKQPEETDEKTALQQFEDEVISFHFQEDGVYSKRQNNVEAKYIAEMVRDFLVHKPELSIGVVAFSMQQQDNIETAIEQLANEDTHFAQLLEEAYTRVEDGQNIGLFVKNLENVQGDERDVIIISVCYGYNEKGKMLMNFGPINRKGGEKRLNVIFSRSKKHMAIVSSIRHNDITNEYNEGANYLKRFLQYAESVSTGNETLAETILDQLSPTEDEQQVNDNITVRQIQAFIHQQGYQTKLNVGLSKFKISIGVINPNNKNEYILGVLIDEASFYNDNETLDKYVLRPNLLNVFDWQTITVFQKDWLDQPELVKQQIKNALEGKAEEPSNKQFNEEKIELEEQDLEEEIDNQFQTRLVHTNEGKFYQVEQHENKLVILFGKLGTEGRVAEKEFSSIEEAKAQMEELLTTKQEQGYQ